MDICVNLIDASSYKASFVNNKIGPPRLTGKLALTQKFIKILLTRPDTDLYCFGLEGYDFSSKFHAVLAETTNTTPLGFIKGQMIDIVNEVSRKIIRQQLKYELTPENCLASAEVGEVYFDEITRVLSVEILLENQSGDKFSTLLEQGKVTNIG